MLPSIELKILTRHSSYIGYISFGGCKLYACIGTQTQVEEELNEQYAELLEKYFV